MSLESYDQVLTGGDLLPTGIWPCLVNSLVIVLPVMAVGLALQRHFARGPTAGALSD